MVQSEVTEQAAVCEVPPEKGTRLYECDMQSNHSAQSKKQQVVVSENSPREGTRLSDGAKVVHAESRTRDGMQTVASPNGVLCETKAGSSCPDGVIEQIGELETMLEPQQGNYFSDVEREDDKGSPKCSEDKTLLKPDSTASEGELLLKAFPTDRVGNVSEGEKVHCEAIVGVQTGTSSVEDRFEEKSNPSSMNRACVGLETCLVQRHVNGWPDAKNYPEIEKDANFHEFRSVKGPASGFVRGSADKLARLRNGADKSKEKGCRKSGSQAHLTCRIADDTTRQVCKNQRKVVRKLHRKRRKRGRVAPQKVEAVGTPQRKRKGWPSGNSTNRTSRRIVRRNWRERSSGKGRASPRRKARLKGTGQSSPDQTSALISPNCGCKPQSIEIFTPPCERLLRPS
ncbi:hypothetical protein HPB51_010039 [Rhipicephalus microplus]|uniref:Uncharacterized protein n=1 Tax=Rhipicephalus microplus TaxID=6941 RepID=A0A9J6DTP8_RHIMP|nr:hypothetical protein HPB51_010039 [Rhipicephalus microplus]